MYVILNTTDHTVVNYMVYDMLYAAEEDLVEHLQRLDKDGTYFSRNDFAICELKTISAIKEISRGKLNVVYKRKEQWNTLTYKSQASPDWGLAVLSPLVRLQSYCMELANGLMIAGTTY